MSQFPLLISLGGNRHELLLVSTSTSLASLQDAVLSATRESPNAAEFMSKYKKAEEGGEKIKGVKVRWSAEGRDTKIWPATTVVTEGNVEAVLGVLERGVGRDVLEVEVGKE